MNSEGDVIYDPISCLYFSIVTFTTLGYGDFRPTNNARLISASEAILGYLVLGIIVGSTVFLLQTFIRPFHQININDDSLSIKNKNT